MDRSKWYEDMTYAEDREDMDKVIDSILERAAKVPEDMCVCRNNGPFEDTCFYCCAAADIRDMITPQFMNKEGLAHPNG